MTLSKNNNNKQTKNNNKQTKNNNKQTKNNNKQTKNNNKQTNNNNKQQLKYFEKRSDWLFKLGELAYEGQFDKGIQLFNKKIKTYDITEEEADEIIACCGPDIHYNFVKPFVDKGGKFPENVVNFAKFTMNSKKEQKAWSKLEGRIEGFKLVLSENEKYKKIEKHK
jgi:hypothetical protein